jgi:caffeoyl-CoA O-methyltransferase
MARALYRFYLYAVSIALVIFIAASLGGLLATLLPFTPLRSTYDSFPDRAHIVQSIALVTVALVFAGPLVGLHYWLIRRDMSDDPAAGASAIRSFFLNVTEGIGVLLAVPLIGFVVIASRAQNPDASIIGPAAFALPTLVLVVLLSAERRRIRVNAGAALVFQRLHLYGAQIVLLIFLTIAWSYEVRPLVDGAFFGGKAAQEACAGSYYCPSYNLFGLGMSLLWFVVAWLSYGWVVKDDNASPLRLILHFLQFAAGVVFLVTGLYRGIEVILLPLFHQGVALKDVIGPYAGTYDFVSPLTLSIVVISAYNGWLRIAARQGLIERQVLFLTECAIVAILAAAVFWWGCDNLLYDTLQIWTHASNPPDTSAWVSAIAFVVAGAGYISLDIYLWRRDLAEPLQTAGPRRGLVFALLGGGILAFTIGGATALYSWIATLLGSPLNDSQQIINAGLGAFIVGLLLLGIYLWVALRERLFSRLSEVPTGASSAAVTNLVDMTNKADTASQADIVESKETGPFPPDEQIRSDAQTRAFIDHELQVRFAPEDDALRDSIARAQAENMPAIQISPLQGKLLQVLAMACGARTILEIGALAGYSGVWLARALPPNGKLISLEISSRHAELVRATFVAAGVSDHAEVRVGSAPDLLPTLVPEAPFDLIFIDADKENYPLYLDWAIKLSRVGSLIVADNVIRGGAVFQTPSDENTEGIAAYNRQILEHPRLVSVAFPNDDDGMDGFAISVVRA